MLSFLYRLLWINFFILPSHVYAADKLIALSFDDAPRRWTGQFSRLQRAKLIVKKLKSVDVDSAVIYANSSHIKDKETREIMRLYEAAGFPIGNHTHSHPSLNMVSFDEYRKDFLKAHKNLSQYSTYKKMFRFPFLREGKDLKKRNQMRTFLKEQGYTSAYITVDFSDWHLEALLRESLEKKQKINFDKLGDLYLSLAKKALDHYDKLAIKYLKRSPKHVMLLHETDIAALFIDDLVKAMKTWGWKVISSEQAYQDPIADFLIPRVLKNNPGRVGELAIHNNHPMQDVWADVTSPKYITKRYNEEVLGLTQ